MTNQIDHRPGDFCWMNLSTSDPESAAEFYRELFGWDVRPWPVTDEREREQVAAYRQFTYNGSLIGGLTGLQGEMPAWAIFFAVDDVDQTASRITAGGGRLLVEPATVPGGNRVAFFTDPAGAICGIQSSTGGGAAIECAMQPNTVCWLEVGSRDADATRGFYTDLFEWRFETLPPGAGADGYSLIHNQDRNFGGMIEMDGKFPEGVSSYWMMYIGVEDLNSTLAEVKRLGGNVGFGPIEIPDGTFAVVSDPQGAHFAVIQPSAEAMARAGA